MKPVRGLDAAPPGLANFIKECPKERKWSVFRNWDGSSAYKELLTELQQKQHDLCCFCEIDLRDDDRQIEHFLPKSNINTPDNRTTHYQNLMACCMGGTRGDLFGPGNPRAEHRDENRYRDPKKGNLSCGQIKDNHEPHTDGAIILDPRKLPRNRPIIRVNHDGEMKPIEASCEEANIPVADVISTIERLGLNCDRLRVARKKRFQNLTEVYRDVELKKYLLAAARAELLPNENDRLPRFFTTGRSFFGLAADRSWLNRIAGYEDNASAGVLPRSLNV